MLFKTTQDFREIKYSTTIRWNCFDDFGDENAILWLETFSRSKPRKNVLDKFLEINKSKQCCELNFHE